MGNKSSRAQGTVIDTQYSDDGATFDLRPDLTFVKDEQTFDDFQEFLYHTKAIQESQGKIIISTKPNSAVLHPEFGNGFIGTVYHAYNAHRNLVLRPDDLWMAITTSLSLFVNAHAEEMRADFVEHDGQLKLVAQSGGDIYSADWEELIDELIRQVDINTKGDTRDWLVPSFSTTTPVISTAAKITMMAIFQNYFSYGIHFLCGIPKVTLRGKAEDWQELKLKVQKLKKLNQPDLKHWSKLLDYVLEKFNNSFNGNVDKSFWSKICHLEGWGSGPRYCAGWLNVFMPFNKRGKYVLKNAHPMLGMWGRIDTEDVPPSIAEVPVEINDNGIEYETKFMAGFFATAYDKNSNTVSPSIDWVVLDVPITSSPEESKWQRLMGPTLWKSFPKGRYFGDTRI